MQDVVAPVSYIPFDIEASLEMQLGALPLPFPGMDSEWKLVLGNYPHDQNQILLRCFEVVFTQVFP